MVDKGGMFEDLVTLIDSKIQDRANRGFFHCNWGCQLTPQLEECLQKHYTAIGFYVGKSYDRYVAWTRPDGFDAEHVRTLTLAADVTPEWKWREFCHVMHMIFDHATLQPKSKALSCFYTIKTMTQCDMKLRLDEVPIFTETIIQSVNQGFWVGDASYMTVSLIELRKLRLEFNRREYF